VIAARVPLKIDCIRVLAPSRSFGTGDQNNNNSEKAKCLTSVRNSTDVHKLPLPMEHQFGMLSASKKSEARRRSAQWLRVLSHQLRGGGDETAWVFLSRSD
jgi:hypothetical protein